MTYEEKIKFEFARNEKISNAILILLLVVRIVDQDLGIWIFGVNVPAWVISWYNSIAYILTATIIWLNRHRLAELNIDRPFITALILGGALYVLRPTYNNAGVLVGITAGLVFWAYINRLFVFRNPVAYPRGTGFLVFLSIPLALAPVLVFGMSLKSSLTPPMFLVFFLSYLQFDLILVVFEEVIFRGALSAYLRRLGWHENSVFFVQAFLFWIAHHRFLLLANQYSFWVALPVMAVLLGLLTWRSKSITPSLIGHFLFNFTSRLLITIT